MNIYTIYKATNIITNKVYIGFDSNWPSRKYTHMYLHRSKYCPKWKFYNSIKKHGWDNFIWEAIYQSKDGDHCLSEMEGAFILENDSFINGYNSTLGGEGTLGKLQTQENKDIISKCTSSRNANSRWYNNGSTNRFSAEHPMDNYVLGRINQKPTTDGCKWYNDGTEQELTRNPQYGWVLGMLPLTGDDLTNKSIRGKNNKGKRRSKEQIEAQSLISSKEISTPDGVFPSAAKAAIHYGIAPCTISNWVKKYPEEFYYTTKENT